MTGASSFPVRTGTVRGAPVHFATMSSSSGMAAVPAADPPVPPAQTPQVEAVVLDGPPVPPAGPAHGVPAGTAQTGTAQTGTAQTGTAETAPVESGTAATGTAETADTGTAENGIAGTGAAGTAGDVTARPAGRGSWLLDELIALTSPVVMPVFRRLPTVMFVLCALMTTICVATVVGAVRDDVAIGRHPVVTTAEVLPGSSFSRTLIRFTSSDGKLLVPERGVFYPRGLREGQFVLVQYDATHPDRVRVLGRTATVGLLPVALMLLGVWAVLLPLGLWLRGRRRRRAAAVAAG